MWPSLSSATSSTTGRIVAGKLGVSPMCMPAEPRPIMCAMTLSLVSADVVFGDHLPPVAEHRDAVRNRQHVVEEVRDEDDGAALAAQPRRASNNLFTSGGDRAEVGSSRMMIWRLRRARAKVRPAAAGRPAGCPCVVRRDRCRGRGWRVASWPRASCGPSRPRPAMVGCAPRNTFSATVRSGTMESSWCTMPMPAASASPASADAPRGR
jgi:hypothetical protein